jgi:ATP-dependent Clp protease ATP-binding subunit ClpC
MVQYAHSVVLAWDIAAAEAKVGNAVAIEPAHLLLGVCKLCDLPWDELRAVSPGADAAIHRELEADIKALQQMFQRAGLDQTLFRRRLRVCVAVPGPAVALDGGMHRSPAARRVFGRAEKLMAVETVARLQPAHLLQALLELPDPPWASLLAEMGVHDPLEQLCRLPPAAQQRAHAQPTPFLERFGRDLTQLARDGKLDPVIGRREEMRSLARVLTQKRKSNAILVGEAGVGKTCVVEGLAQRLIGPNAPLVLKDKRVIEVAMAGLVAGTKYRGEFEERMQALIKEASTSEDTVLFIDEIHTLLGAGGEGASDAANILKPALARGALRCIGATTIAEYRKYIERDPALERRFQVVWVNEPTRAEAVEILQGLRPQFEAHHGLTITDSAIEAAVDLSMRYLPDFRLPDKAIDLIDQACASDRIASLSVRSDLPAEAHIGHEEVAAVVAWRCRIPVNRLTENEAQRLLRMEDTLRQRVIGQDEAIRVVSDAIRAARVGLKHPRKPIGVFLFAGATGTGKTEMTKALAEFLFDDEQRLVHIDMSEYMEKHTVSRLIGAPPGYIGHDEEGQLTGPVRTHPYSVVLFDEVEKARPQVLDIFLQLFDEGCVTDTRGRRVSFTETVIILTSNLGSQPDVPARPLGFAPGGAPVEHEEAVRERYHRRIMETVRGALRPELLNRIQHLVCFEPLSAAVVRQIIDKILDSLRARLRERRINVELTEAAYALLMQAGFDAQYGAREMERAVDRLLVQPLGKALLAGDFAEGTTVWVDTHNGELVLEDAEAHVR